MHRMQKARTEFKLKQSLSGESSAPLVIFVCVHNAGRSRMAEAFMQQLAGDRYRVMSAGTQPSPRPHAEVVEAMKAIDMDIPMTPGRLLTQELADEAHLLVGMGCNVEEACPALRVPLEDWELDDPKGQPPDQVAEIRDKIEM